MAGIPDLTEILEQVGVEHFLAVAPIEALDEGVRIRLARLDEAKVDQVLLAP